MDEKLLSQAPLKTAADYRAAIDELLGDDAANEASATGDEDALRHGFCDFLCSEIFEAVIRDQESCSYGDRLARKGGVCGGPVRARSEKSLRHVVLWPRTWPARVAPAGGDGRSAGQGRV